MDAKLLEGHNSEDESLTQSSSSSEDNSVEGNDSAEERRLKEENLPDSFSSDEPYFPDDMLSDEENFTNYSTSVVKKLTGNLSEENDNSSEEGSFEDDRYIKENGLVFERPAVKKEVRRIEIVTVGDRDCGKTQLIESVFGDHPSFTVADRGTREQYHVYLSEKMFFHIFIYDIKDIEYMRKLDFSSKSIFFFCYDVDDLDTLNYVEETWIPFFFRNLDKRMVYFLVGIESAPTTEETAAERVNNHEDKLAAKEKIEESFYRHNSSCLICSIKNKTSMLNVFQAAIDAAYPRTSIG